MTSIIGSKASSAAAIVAVVMLLFVGGTLVPQYARACDDCLGYVDTYGDNLGYVDTYGDNLGYVDIYGDNLGYVDTYGDNLGYVDLYGDNLGYVDTYGDNLGYVDTYGDNLGYGYIDTYDDYWTDCGSCVSSGGGGAMYYSSYNPPKFSMPNFSYPMSVSYPKPYNPPPIHVSTGTSYVPATPTINNVNNNTNTNTNVNNINVSATAIAIAPAIPQYATGYTYPVTQPAPYCTISITNQYGVGYGYGQQTLTWSSANATSANIFPYIGSVSTSGSRIVYPTANQIYTMTVYGPGGTSTCQTQTYYVTPIASQPYVSLTQIPYTGFDFGPVGNMLYWLALISVAVAGAYLVVYYMPALFMQGAQREMSPIRVTLPVLGSKNEVRETKTSNRGVRNTIDSMILSSTGISINRT